MSGDCVLELESLLSGEKNSIEISACHSSRLREEIIAKLTELMTDLLPGCWLEGEFVNKESSDYMVYDLHLSGVSATGSFSSIRLFDFGDKLRLIRV